MIEDDHSIDRIHDLILSAATKSRSARFEHGACGAPSTHSGEDSALLKNMIVDYIYQNPQKILDILSKHPKVGKSSLFRNNPCHLFKDASKNLKITNNDFRSSHHISEEIKRIYGNVIDVIYRYHIMGQSWTSYSIIHIVRPDGYDVLEEMEKYYIHSSHARYLIWSQEKFHSANIIPSGKYIQQCDINLLTNQR